MEWEDLSNAEIEVKLKSMEFEYDSTSSKIKEMYKILNKLNNDYIDGKKLLDKRLKRF